MTAPALDRFLDTTPRRIHIVGGPGSGKTTLAAQIASRVSLPVHCLDDVARVGGGVGELRSPAARAAMVDEILRSDTWITEGVHLGWTAPLMEAADVVVWLDSVSRPHATRRIVRRFFGGAVNELRRRPMRERFTRFRDYGRQLRALGGAVRETHGYYGESSVGGPADPTDLSVDGSPRSRLQTESALAPYRQKLVRCRSSADTASLLLRFA